MEQNEQLLSYDERRRRALVIQRERREAQVRRNLRILTGVIITVLTAVTAAGIHTITKKPVSNRAAGRRPPRYMSSSRKNSRK